MFVFMDIDRMTTSDTVFRLRALKLGDYYVGSVNFESYEFKVQHGWNAHHASTAILATLSHDNDRPIKVTLGEETIRIDPIIAGELFDCLFAFTNIKDYQKVIDIKDTSREKSSKNTSKRYRRT